MTAFFGRIDGAFNDRLTLFQVNVRIVDETIAVLDSDRFLGVGDGLLIQEGFNLFRVVCKQVKIDIAGSPHRSLKHRTDEQRAERFKKFQVFQRQQAQMEETLGEHLPFVALDQPHQLGVNLGVGRQMRA